jgi:hypothetical protein
MLPHCQFHSCHLEKDKKTREITIKIRFCKLEAKARDQNKYIYIYILQILKIRLRNDSSI